MLIGDELLRDLKFDSRRYQICMWADLRDPQYEQHSKASCPSCEPIHRAYAGDSRPSFCFGGTMFHVNARNRSLVYRIGQYRPRSRTWEASWPD